MIFFHNFTNCNVIVIVITIISQGMTRKSKSSYSCAFSLKGRPRSQNPKCIIVILRTSGDIFAYAQHANNSINSHSGHDNFQNPSFFSFRLSAEFLSNPNHATCKPYTFQFIFLPPKICKFTINTIFCRCSLSHRFTIQNAQPFILRNNLWRGKWNWRKLWHIWDFFIALHNSFICEYSRDTGSFRVVWA